MRGQGYSRGGRSCPYRQNRFPDHAIDIKLTVSQYNYDQILRVYWLAVKLDAVFLFKPVENLQNFTNSRKPLEVSLRWTRSASSGTNALSYRTLCAGKGTTGRQNFIRISFTWRKKMPASCSVLNDHLTMPAGECYFV